MSGSERAKMANCGKHPRECMDEAWACMACHEDERRALFDLGVAQANEAHAEVIVGAGLLFEAQAAKTTNEGARLSLAMAAKTLAELAALVRTLTPSDLPGRPS